MKQHDITQTKISKNISHQIRKVEIAIILIMVVMIEMIIGIALIDIQHMPTITDRMKYYLKNSRYRFVIVVIRLIKCKLLEDQEYKERGHSQDYSKGSYPFICPQINLTT